MLLLELIRKAHLYDPTRGASPYTWACRVLDKEYLMILRNRHRLKRAAGIRAQSLETDTVIVRGRAVAVRDVVDGDRRRAAGNTGQDQAAAVETAEAVKHTLDALPPKLLKLAKLLMTGTPAAAARSLGISRRQLYADMAEIRRRFSGAGLDARG